MENRLGSCASLYLRQHKDNPVAWQPWDDAALSLARQLDRPLFVSIGYSSCHWCHVMENEAFSHPETAGLINNFYVPIKVDREERPDIDEFYMTAVRHMTGGGGWPLTLVLDPHTLAPFFGGTYFPIRDSRGLPGLGRVLTALADLRAKEPGRVEAYSHELVSGMTDPESHRETIVPGGPVLHAAGAVLEQEAPGPRFPMIPHHRALLVLAASGGSIEFDSLPSLARTLRERSAAMVLGGCQDHIGGGFHRYAVDPSWTIPHFEKMLYDQGLMLEYFADLAAGDGSNPVLWLKAATGIFDCLERDFRLSSGLYASGLDADDQEGEGRYYTWQAEEIRSVLDSHGHAALSEDFNLGNAYHEGRLVLTRRHEGPLSPETERVLGELAQARSRRPAPGLDKKAILSWNALAVSGLARFGTVARDKTAIDRALRIVELIDTLLGESSGGLSRIYYDSGPSVPAMAEDYVFLVRAYLDLVRALTAGDYPAELVGTLIERARDLQELLDRTWGSAAGGWFSGPGPGKVLPRMREVSDNALPSVNGTGAINLARLFHLTGDIDYESRCRFVLSAFGDRMREHPASCPSLGEAACILDGGGSLTAQAPVLAEAGRKLLPGTELITGSAPDGSWALFCRGTACTALRGLADIPALKDY